MTTSPKSGTARSCFRRNVAVANPQSGGGEGRCRTGRNEHVHREGCRGTGPGIQGNVRRDNVGKDHLPAGAGGNLQGPADRGMTEGGGRDLVWRMSLYVRRRRGNALRGGARDATLAKATPEPGKGALGTWRSQGGPPDAELGKADPRSSDEAGRKPLREGVYVRQRLNLARGGKAAGRKPRSEPDSGNPTVRDRRGARGNVAHGGTVTPRCATERAAMETLRLQERAPRFYPDTWPLREMSGFRARLAAGLRPRSACGGSRERPNRSREERQRRSEAAGMSRERAWPSH